MVHLIAQARNLRRGETEAERVLWSYLRNRQLKGCKFRRQVQIGSFFVDFVCFEKSVVIELDGGHHQKHWIYDEGRSKVLGQKGFRVLRFWNREVMENIEGILGRIREVLV